MLKTGVKFSNMLAPSFHSDFVARCRQVISRYFLGSESATIVPLNASQGFSGARICRVEFVDQVLALRCWPSTAPDVTRLAGLHRLLEHTSRLGIKQIAVPLRTLTGDTLTQLDGRWWQLEPWMPGVADFHVRPSRIRLRHSMQVLARWHLAASKFTPRGAEAAWFTSHNSAPSPGLQERLQTINEWRSGGEGRFRHLLQNYPSSALRPYLPKVWQQFELLAPSIARRLETLLKVNIPLQPALRDVWHDHLLFTGEELTGLIDPSACRTESVTTDLARLLGSLVEDDRAEWDFALSCYQEVRPLSLAELQLLTAFDASGILLSGMTWLDWLLVQQRQFENCDQVLARVELVLQRMSRLQIP